MTIFYKIKGSKGKGHIKDNDGITICGWYPAGWQFKELEPTTENLCKHCLKWSERNGEK